jgi:hypothetical protein
LPVDGPADPRTLGGRFSTLSHRPGPASRAWAAGDRPDAGSNEGMDWMEMPVVAQEQSRHGSRRKESPWAPAAFLRRS